MIVACRTGRHEPGSTSSELLDDVGIDLVIHEDRDRRRACGQYCRVGTKQRLKIHDLMFMTSIKLIEQSAFVLRSAFLPPA